jgi:hypothetical protein
MRISHRNNAQPLQPRSTRVRYRGRGGKATFVVKSVQRQSLCRYHTIFHADAHQSQRSHYIRIRLQFISHAHAVTLGAGRHTYKWHYQSSGTPNVNALPFVTRRSPHSDRARRRLVYPTEPKTFNSRGISGFNLFVQPDLVVQLIPVTGEGQIGRGIAT